MTTWEIPAEPEGVRRVWTPDATGDGHLEWVNEFNPARAAHMWRLVGNPDRLSGWSTWGEVLDHGPATDEDPGRPPRVYWSPGLKALYVDSHSGYRLVWFGGEIPGPLGTVRSSLPTDAAEMSL